MNERQSPSRGIITWTLSCDFNWHSVEEFCHDDGAVGASALRFVSQSRDVRCQSIDVGCRLALTVDVSWSFARSCRTVQRMTSSVASHRELGPAPRRARSAFGASATKLRCPCGDSHRSACVLLALDPRCRMRHPCHARARGASPRRRDACASPRCRSRDARSQLGSSRVGRRRPRHARQPLGHVVRLL